MKQQLLELLGKDPRKALDYYFRNENKIKGVDYNSALFDTTIVRFLTIDNIDYEVERKELQLEPELV